MDENSKRQFDSILELNKQSWARITERRKYEWSVSFKIWAAIGAFIALLVTTPESNGVLMATLTGIIGVGITFIHGRWLYELNTSTSHDRKMAIYDERKLRALCDYDFDKKFLKELQERAKKQERFISSWSPFNELVITGVLVILAVVVAIPNK